MSEHLSPQQIELFREQKLGLGESLKLYEHLGVCDACSEQFSALTGLSEQISPLELEFKLEDDEEFSHLRYDQEIELYVDNQLDPAAREIAESHLAICTQCAAEVKNLQEFRESLKPLLAKSYAPNPKLAAQSKTVWQEKLSGLRFRLQPRRWSLAPLAGGAALIIIVLTAIFWLPLWSSPQEELIQQTPGSPDSPTPNEVANADANTNQNQTEAHQQTSLSVDNKSAQSKTAQSKSATVSAPTQERAAARQIRFAVRDGNHQIILDEQGRLSGAEHLPTAWQQEIKALLIAGKLKKPQTLVGLTAQKGVLLGANGSGAPFALTSPLGVVIESERPTFRWQALPGAQSYLVTIFDSNLNRVLESEPLTTVAVAEWRPPRALERGARYSWQVAALKDNQRMIAPTLPAPEARFMILDAKKARELAQARQNFPSSHLALGVLYWQAGLIDEAEREFEALRRANPRSAAAGRLLESARAWKARAR